MAVPLESYTVRKKGIVSNDTLKSIADKYHTSAQALKYFNRNSPYYDEIKKLNTGDGLTNFASKIDPAKIPTLQVPKIPSGNSTTNKKTDSVSSSSYDSIVSKRIILKRINASYITAVKENNPVKQIIPFLANNKDIGKYLSSKEFIKYSQWTPLYELIKGLNSLTGQAQIQFFLEYRNYYAEVLSLYRTEQDRIIKFNIMNTDNPTQTPPDSEADKKQVLSVIEKIVDLTAHEDSYGHWWLEIYQTDIDLPANSDNNKSASLYESVTPMNLKASYGFWPLEGAALFGGAVTGSVPGGINREENFSIHSSKDQFDPYANQEQISWKVDNALFSTDPYGRSEDVIYQDIMDYLAAYPLDKRWAWPSHNENQEHCQTFQKQLLFACGLIAAPKIKKDQYPPMDKYQVFYGVEPPDGYSPPSIPSYP